MSNDIALQKLGNIDYIPKNRSLCKNCEFYKECPFEYMCPSINRLLEFEAENGEL